jgi:iron complex outermembrane receptor protein
VNQRWQLGSLTVAIGVLSSGFQPAIAEVITSDAIPRLQNFPRAATSLQEWVAQDPQPQLLRITNVQWTATADGLDIQLDTSDGTLSPSTPSPSGNRLITEIPNAVLDTPPEQILQADNPAPGIATIAIRQATPTSVQIVLTGTTKLPTAQVQVSDRRLRLSVLPPEEDTEEGSEEELVVTAQKRPERPQDVPISITTLDRPTILDAQINFLRDIAVNTPNFYATTGDRAFNFYSIRGLSNSNFLTRDSAGFYIDDVPYEYAHQFLSGVFFDLERIEVLRGSQSTLYGRNSQAGVVNILSRQPSNTPEFSLSAGYGNFAQHQFQGATGGAIVPDRLTFRLAGAYNARDGSTKITNLDNERANDLSSGGVRGILQWTPSKEWTVSLNAGYSGNNDGDTIYVPITQDDPFKIERNQVGKLNLGINTQSLRIAYDGPKFRFTAITGRNHTDLRYRFDADYTGTDLFNSDVTLESTIWTQEVRLQSPKTASNFQWTIGGFFQARSFDIVPQSTTTTPLAAAAFGTPAGTNRLSAEYEQTTFAAFGQIDFKPVEPLTLTAGLRYESSQETLDRDSKFEALTGEITPSGISLRDSKVSDDVVLPRFAISYRFSPSILLYGSATRGYKPPTQNYQAEDRTLRRVAAEKSWNYEVGLKSSFWNDRLSVNFAAFWNDISNYQVVLAGPNGFFQDIVNAEVKVRGVELEVVAKPIAGLELIAGVGTAKATYRDYRNPFTGESFRGNRLIFSPDYTYNVALQYRSPGGFFSRLEIQGYGTVFFNDPNTVKEDPVTLVNLRVGFEQKNYGLYLYVNNLFDREYVNQAFSDSVLASYGDRRTFGFLVRTSF